MNVVRFTTLEQLAPFATDWDRLSAGVPFRSWAWMSTWWRHYGGGRKSLYVLGVFDGADRLIGIAPWYLDRSFLWGRVLRFLGSGEICSEYLGILADPSAESQVAEAIADWLTAAAKGRVQTAEGRGNGNCLLPTAYCQLPADRWDLLELTGVDAEDSSIRQLTQALRARGNLVHQRPGPPCWRIELPETWDQYFAMLPKGRRKHMRRSERSYLDSGRAVVHVVREADLPEGIGILIDLHQRRRQSLGEPGCFASPRFTAFHREVMPLLLRSGQLHLFWVEVDGKPAAAAYDLLGSDTTYSYQGGLNPDCMNHSPGRLGHLLGLKHAMARGHTAFDLLRGDEPYKLEFHAFPRAMTETRVAAPRLGARLRWMAWLLGSRAKRWAKRLLRPTPGTPSAATEPEQDASREAAVPPDAGQPELVGAAEDR